MDKISFSFLHSLWFISYSRYWRTFHTVYRFLLVSFRHLYHFRFYLIFYYYYYFRLLFNFYVVVWLSSFAPVYFFLSLRLCIASSQCVMCVCVCSAVKSICVSANTVRKWENMKRRICSFCGDVAVLVVGEIFCAKFNSMNNDRYFKCITFCFLVGAVVIVVLFTFPHTLGVGKVLEWVKKMKLSQNWFLSVLTQKSGLLM